MRLYFVRHGESEANTTGVFSNRPPGPGLTEQGCEQARALAQELRGEGPTAIYSSPLLRATQTAAILGEAWGLPYEVSDALREYDMGIWEGRDDRVAWEGNQALFMAWTIHKRWEQRIPEGESFGDLRRRLDPFVKGLVAAHRATDARLVLVGHGGIYLALLPMLLYNVRYRWALGHALANAAVVVAEPDERGLRCLTWGGYTPPEA